VTIIDVGQHAHTQGTSPSTSFTTGAVTTAVSGSTFVIGMLSGGSTNPATPTDSKGNTYTQIRATVNHTAWFYCENGIGGAGHTATGKQAASDSGTVYFVEITNGLTSGIKDQDVTGIQDLATPFTTNTTGTTVQANELALALYATGTPSGTEVITWGNGFTQVDADGNSSFVTGGIAKKVLSATGTVQGSITSSVATDATGFVATFKEVAAAAGILLSQLERGIRGLERGMNYGRG
jgi:hypothetical protein